MTTYDLLTETRERIATLTRNVEHMTRELDLAGCECAKHENHGGACLSESCACH